MTDAEIVKAYERIEEQNGGMANTSPRHILELTAKELDIDIDRVRSVMINNWNCGGAG
jgi:hypothetical protein